MKLKKILVSAALSLALGITALAVAVGTKAEKAQEVSAHSTSGMTLVHQGNSESLVGRSAYVIGSATSYGIRNDGKFGKDGTLLEFVIAEGTSGSTIRLTRADNGKYLNNPVNGSYSDSPVDRYIDSNYYLCADSATERYYRGGKYFGEATVYYEAYDPDMPTAMSLVTKFQVWAAPAKLNLKVNDSWASDGARFAAYFFGNGDNTTWVDMSLVSGSTRLYTVSVPDGYSSVIFCRLNGDNLSDDWNNVINQTGNLSVTDGNYYLMYDDSWDSGIWHDGKNSVYVEGDFTDPTWTALDDNKLTWNKLTGQYEAKAYDALPKDANYKVVDVTTSNWVGYSYGITNDHDLFSQGDDNNIVCNSNTSYDIYYKPQHGSIWVEENATVAATHFAGTFLTVTGGICKDSSAGLGDTDIETLKAAWNAKGDGTTLVDKWNVLSSGAKGVFASGTGHADIVSAVARYRVIMGRYSGKLTAFTDGPELAGGNALVTSETSTTNQTLIIAIVAALAIVSVGGFVFIRRRREN